MLVDILAKLVLWLIEIVCFVLPGWQLPDFIISAFNYFMFTVVGITHMIPFLQSVIISLIVMIIYKTSVILANITFGFVALIRGSGKPEV